MTTEHETIAVVDFGSQYTQLIARRIRELGVYAVIISCEKGVEEVKKLQPIGIILSGGPSSVHDDGAPSIDPAIFKLGLPVLGICYGLQLMAHLLGGRVIPSKHREYGRRAVNVLPNSRPPFTGLSAETTTWMSHGDQIENLPDEFKVTAKSDSCPVAAMHREADRLYGVQFHPEVRHTTDGTPFLKSFLYDVCYARGGWTMELFEQEAIERIRAQVGDRHVIGGVSGGVDSSVMAALMGRAIGDNFTGIFVDNGLLRKNERLEVENALAGKLGVHLHTVDASDLFLSALKDIIDPELKRKRIGNTFIEVFQEEAKRFKDSRFLAQGTLYPDVIESVSFRGPSATIKTHHNVGGLPEKMNMALVEPLRELFKDEVRALGRELGLPDHLVNRHPFPGPGLAVRILGEVTRERLAILREADAIFLHELRNSGWYDKVSQALAVLLPVKSVGVMGDARTYENVIALRSVDTWDFMTADFSPLPMELLGTISTRIINEVEGVNRVVYDISSKPPATVEWE
ncbi:glutamine-hydrolyzing GMP synthase [bacterium]|nr:glutamine-hydrolyzing GMP synthase [bacterium]